MHVICNQQDLDRGLSVVSHAISSRSTLPILANILLTTDNDRLRLSSTNLEIGINYWIKGEIRQEGTTTVPAKTFTDLVSSLQAGEIELLVPEDSYTIQVKKGVKSNAKIKGMDPEEFPEIPTVKGDEPLLILEAKQLKEIIREVAIAVADDDSRPALTAVEMKVEQQNIMFAAADAFRLAIRDVIFSSERKDDETLLIPGSTLQRLARILPNEGDVQITTSPNRSQVLFHTESMDLVSRLIEAEFPNVRGAVPQQYTTRATISTKEFATAIKSVTPFARDSSNITRVKIEKGTDGAPGQLVLEAIAEDVGSNVATVNAVVDGQGMAQIIFNCQYLADVLSALEAEQVALEVTTSARPGVIRPVGNQAAFYSYTLMPMSSNR